MFDGIINGFKNNSTGMIIASYFIELEPYLERIFGLAEKAAVDLNRSSPRNCSVSFEYFNSCVVGMMGYYTFFSFYSDLAEAFSDRKEDAKKWFSRPWIVKYLSEIEAYFYFSVNTKKEAKWVREMVLDLFDCK